MRILLTGATGFIGSHIAQRLVQEGHEVRMAARPESDLARVHEVVERLERIPIDLFTAEPPDLARLCAGIELCIHAAWYAVPGKYLAAPENLACVAGSLRLLEALAAAGCRRVVFIGSCFEYDFDAGYLSEESPVRPQSLYAASKLATRYMGEQAARLSGVAFVWARLFYQYGPFEDSRRLVPYVIETLLRGEAVEVTRGTQVRDFLHVSDVASAIVRLGLGDVEGVVNVGSGQPVTVRRIVATIERLLDRQGQVRFGARPENPTDPPFVCANNRKLVAATGWSPQFDLESGLEQTIRWTRERARG